MNIEENHIQQLYRQSPDGQGGKREEALFPATLTRSVYDGQTGLTLETILRYFNSLFLEYRGTDEATRRAVPPMLRREGIVISYINLYHTMVNERCVNAVDKNTDDWGDGKNWARLYYVGNEYIPAVDRGPWKSGEDYYAEALNPMTGRYETSDVWMNGCRYRCRRTGTLSTPAWNSTDWMMIEGNPEFTVDFEEADTVVDPTGFDITLTLVARLHNVNIIDDIHTEDIVWSRYSLDAYGEERTESDRIWNLRRGGSGKSLRLTEADIDGGYSWPAKVAFTATVTLEDGVNELITDSVTYEY